MLVTVVDYVNATHSEQQAQYQSCSERTLFRIGASSSRP